MNALYDSLLKKIEKQGGWTFLYDEKLDAETYHYIFLTPSHTILQFTVCENLITNAVQIIREE
jgi:hypothetical protein